MNQSSNKISLVQFSRGAYITVEGKSSADNFYIIRSGRVQISKSTEIVQEEGGNVLGPGDFFGVVSAMASQRRIETARALTDCSLIAVHKGGYASLIQNNTQVAMKIIENFSRRMRFLDHSLTRLTSKKTSESDITHIYQIAQYYLKNEQYTQAYYALYQYIEYCPNDANVEKARQQLSEIEDQANTGYLKNVNVGEFTRRYPKDAVIFLEMMPGQELYIIQQGSVKIAKIANNNEVMLALLRQGDIFGEMALLDKKPRSASAIAFEDSVLLAVNRANFENIVHTQPQIIVRLTTLLAERIWVIYRQLANTTIPNPMGRLYDAVVVQLEKKHVPLSATQEYTLDFGPQELVNWVGLPIAEGNVLLRDFLSDRFIGLSGGKLHVLNTEEAHKQSQYHRKTLK